jgi:hypothetical protein
VSGTPGSPELKSKYFTFSIDCGINYAPIGDANEVGEFYEKQGDPYRRWAEAALPALEKYVEGVAEQKILPLSPHDPNAPEIFGTYIRDILMKPTSRSDLASAEYSRKNGEKWFKDHPGKCVQTLLDHQVGRSGEGYRTERFTLRISFHRPIKESELQTFFDEIVKILRACRPPKEEGLGR